MKHSFPCSRGNNCKHFGHVSDFESVSSTISSRPLFFCFRFLVTFYFSSVSLLHEFLFPLLSHRPGGKHTLVDAIQFPFSSLVNNAESSRHLVSNAIFFTRETSNFPVLFFFVHHAEIAEALALPQLIFRRVEARLSIGRRREHRPSFKRN